MLLWEPWHSKHGEIGETMTIQYSNSREPKDFFTGYTFFKARSVADRFTKDPSKITPVELIEWALVEGEWYLGCDTSGAGVWYGPIGDRPMPGQNKIAFSELKEATEEMLLQYGSWWNMRQTYDTAMKEFSEKVANEFLKRLKGQTKKEADKAEDTSFDKFLESLEDELEDNEPDEDTPEES